MLRPLFATNRAIAIAVVAVVLGMISWIASMAWLHTAWRKLAAVARVEHISVGTIPDAVNGAVGQFPWFVALVLGTMGILLTRRWLLERRAREELAAHILQGGDAQIQEDLVKVVEERHRGTRRLTRAFIWACGVGSVGNAILVAFILWAVRGYFS